MSQNPAIPGGRREADSPKIVLAFRHLGGIELALLREAQDTKWIKDDLNFVERRMPVGICRGGLVDAAADALVDLAIHGEVRTGRELVDIHLGPALRTERNATGRAFGSRELHWWATRRIEFDLSRRNQKGTESRRRSSWRAVRDISRSTDAQRQHDERVPLVDYLMVADLHRTMSGSPMSGRTSFCQVCSDWGAEVRPVYGNEPWSWGIADPQDGPGQWGLVGCKAGPAEGAWFRCTKRGEPTQRSKRCSVRLSSGR